MSRRRRTTLKSPADALERLQEDVAQRDAPSSPKFEQVVGAEGVAVDVARVDARRPTLESFIHRASRDVRFSQRTHDVSTLVRGDVRARISPHTLHLRRARVRLRRSQRAHLLSRKDVRQVFRTTRRRRHLALALARRRGVVVLIVVIHRLILLLVVVVVSKKIPAAAAARASSQPPPSSRRRRPETRRTRHPTLPRPRPKHHLHLLFHPQLDVSQRSRPRGRPAASPSRVRPLVAVLRQEDVPERRQPSRHRRLFRRGRRRSRRTRRGRGGGRVVVGTSRRRRRCPRRRRRCPRVGRVSSVTRSAPIAPIHHPHAAASTLSSSSTAPVRFVQE